MVDFGTEEVGFGAGPKTIGFKVVILFRLVVSSAKVSVESEIKMIV